ncbi:MAG: hypothetical protein U1E76_18730 [Planctomycetota bacterium]
MSETNTRARLTYSVGNEHDPGDPFGRSELAIQRDGWARLEQHRIGQPKIWTGRVQAEALDRLWSALERGGFPNVPRHPIPGGSAMRKLAANAGGVTQSVAVAWHAAKNLPGYDDAFTTLDGIIRQLSQDTVQHVPAAPTMIVTDVRRVC